MKLGIRILLLGLITFLLNGCATNRNIPLQESFWQNPKQKITVAAYKPSKPDIFIEGDQGLLDMAITGIANKDLSNALKNTDVKWYQEMPETFAKRLNQGKMVATVYQQPLDNNRKKHPNVLAETNGDLLLTLELRAIGAKRRYAAGFIPSGGPEARCVLVGELVDPRDKKKVLWHHETEILQKVEGKWDEPPGFTNFNNALQLAITDARQEMLDSLFSGR